MKNIAISKKFKMLFKKFFSSNKRVTTFAVALILIVVVLFLSTIFGGKKTNEKISLNSSQKTSVSDYSKSIENKIEEMIYATGKVSNVSAFVMVESSPETKYLTESDESVVTNENGITTSTKSTTVVFQKDGSITTPIVITTIMPKVSGVMIVMSKVDASTKLSIQNALSVVLNIDASCISILQES